MSDITSKSANVYARLYDSNGTEKYEYESFLTSRSPPTLALHSISLSASSYKIGDTVSATLSVQKHSGDNVYVSSGYFLYDADGNYVTVKTTTTFELTDTTKKTESYSDYVLKANSFTLGQWKWDFSTSVGWSDDTVYLSDGTKYEHAYTKYYTQTLYANVQKPPPELKLGSKNQHKIPSSITKGVDTTFEIYVINTYNSDKTIQLQIKFEKSSSISYTHTSPTMTAKANTSELYSVTVNIPLSYTGNGTNDVYVNLCENKC